MRPGLRDPAVPYFRSVFNLDASGAIHLLMLCSDVAYRVGASEPSPGRPSENCDRSLCARVRLSGIDGLAGIRPGGDLTTASGS
jgi:hypothetical protein